MKSFFVVVGALALGGVALLSQPEPVRRVGPLEDGGFFLNSGWILRPAGKQIPVGTFPMASVATPDGKYLLVMNGGFNPPAISVIDIAAEKELDRVRVTDAWLGLALARNGKTLYVGGGSQSAVFEFNLSNEGKLTAARTFTVVPQAERKNTDFIGDVTFSPDDRLLYAADLYKNQIVVINPQSGRVIETFKTGRRPYKILFHPDGKSFFVSSWLDGAIYHHEADSGKLIASYRVGPHTTDMLWADGFPKKDEEDKEPSPYSARIFVTAANTNKVYVLGVTPAKELRTVEAINVSLEPQQPLGMTPSALALTKDKKRLYVVCSDANTVAVVDVAELQSVVQGFIPAGWYPTGVRALANGKVAVLNGRGLRSYPNPNGPNPARRAAPSHGGIRSDQYVGAIQLGTVAMIDAPDAEAIAKHTRTVMMNSPYRDKLLAELTEIPKGNPVPRSPADQSPIQHVLYIVKENRTYDQVLGDLGKGNGDPSLTLFDEKSAPNHHKLAREFVLLDNFYVSADVSADGHSWTTSAIGTDYIQKMWPNSYAGRRKLYDYEGQEPTSRPPAGYIWTQVASAGLPLRNYGYFADNIVPAPASGAQVKSVRDPVLRQATNMDYRAFDLDYPDIKRAEVFLADLQRMERENSMPRFMVMRLGNDHTSGTAPGKIAPLSAMADNDAALGQIVEACSRSKFWPRMAIFVLQDDAQNGADHVDSHRSPAYVLSPYTRRNGYLDSTFYNTTSMLRTMELILGLRPMTTYDAAAPPMWRAFAHQPDNSPYVAEKARIPVDSKNPAQSASAKRSQSMDFTEADRIDDDELNDILWAAIKQTPAPAPTRSFFGR
ncbi:MAG: bifunctional YncE family protein/alkaline phosphatase family protein [Bryobacterales bacterium]|nr:bifunctional YncE family protein/alkaline phosphatase family protein [Bryobacterales bacterium]